MVLGILWKRPVKELCTAVFWRDMWTEMMCSMILLFAATACGLKLTEDEDPQPALVLAFANGMVVFVIIETLGHVSGACMNPTVTLMFMITKKLSPLKAFAYIVAELAGAAFGAGIAYGVSTEVAQEAYAPISLQNVTIGQGIAAEAMITHTLALAIQGATDAQHRTLGVFMPGLVVGMAVVVNLLSVVRITGAAMNPLISFGPCAVTGNFKDHWIYWVGPIIGMVIAALEYNLIYSSFWPKKEETEEHIEEIKAVAAKKASNGTAAYENSAYEVQEEPQTRF